MNNKGQGLIIVILCIPIVVLLLCSVIEFSNIYYHKTKIEKLTKTIITNNIEKNNKDDIINLYHGNKAEYENIDIIFDEDSLEIKIDIKVDSIAGKIIGKDHYLVSSDIIGYKENDEVKFKKGNSDEKEG